MPTAVKNKEENLALTAPNTNTDTDHKQQVWSVNKSVFGEFSPGLRCVLLLALYLRYLIKIIVVDK